LATAKNTVLLDYLIYVERLIIIKDVRLIIKPSIARRLLKQGFQIVDIKPQKQIDGTTDFTRCVFLFGYKDGIDKATNKKLKWMYYDDYINN